jgi:endonuclease III
MKSAAEARAILKELKRQHPRADTELTFEGPFQLTVATVLSAQTTDVRVNQVTPALFARYPDAPALAGAEPGELERLIRPTGFFRQKTRTLINLARAIVEQHHGQVPARMAELTELPGIGRKTANVILGHAFGVPGLAVDRHVLRVTSRIGLADSDDPAEVERQVCRLLPRTVWTLASDTLILHGRRVCRPRPLCDRCSVRAECDFVQHGELPRARGAVVGGRDTRASAPGDAAALKRGPRVKRREGAK